jgi:hypothetical protein
MELHVEDVRSAFDAAALYGARVRSYSGRGMGGEECAAIVVESTSEMASFFVALAHEIERDEAENVAKRTRTDEMGHGVIVYWPGCTLDGAPDA